LRKLGHAFRTACDTEVLLAAWSEWGPDCLHRLNGMWAFGLYDARRRLLFASRDRFGVKPFHYAWDGRRLVFASEIKGLRAHPGVPGGPHEDTLRAFLTGGFLDEGEATFFEGIRSLPPGHSLSLDIDTRALRVVRWYDLPHPEERPGSPEELRGLLESAVALRLRSDVDVGSCLSGGLDSSSIVLLTARLRDVSAGGRHRVFSVLYPDVGLDESPFVDSVVRASGVEASAARPTSAELLADLPRVAQDQDEPFPSAGVYSQWRVMRLANEAGIRVLLDGQGGDEALAGPTRALGEARAAARVTGRPLAFFLGLFAYHALPIPETLRARLLASSATHGRVPANLLNRAAGGRALPRSARHQARRTLAHERRAELSAASLPALLRYEDRSSMAFSIEARTPFLDYRLVERALALPATNLIRDGWTKALLREAMKGLLPEEVRLRRDKLGFGTPERRWLREIAPQVREWLRLVSAELWLRQLEKAPHVA
jgi:asparagine synthase (glutamine-hydrolysing)